MLLVGIIDPAGSPDSRIGTEEASAGTALTTSAQATAVSPPAQPSTTTAKNRLGGLVRATNINTGDAFTAALAKLETLPIKGRAPKTGYSREAFGPAWADDVNVEGGHNGCDTRNDILRRDLIDITVKPASNGYTVCPAPSSTPTPAGRFRSPAAPRRLRLFRSIMWWP